MRAKPLPCLLVVLLAAGAWQFGSGVWIHAKAQLAQYLIEQAWQRTLVRGEPVKPWPRADTWPVARLQWRDKVDLYVLAGINGASLPFGPGMETRDENQPILIAGHRDTHFAFLARIRTGDRVTFTDTQGKRAVFRVSAREIVDSREEALTAGANTRGLILVTCYPFDALRAGGPLRFVVTAARQISVKNNSL